MATKKSAQKPKSAKVAAQPATVTPAAEVTKAKVTEKPVDATLYIATEKVCKPGTFFAAVQAAAAKPVKLADLISGLCTTHGTPEGKGLVPKSKKEHDMVIRVRTNYAANHGYLKAVKEAA